MKSVRIKEKRKLNSVFPVVLQKRSELHEKGTIETRN